MIEREGTGHTKSGQALFASGEEAMVCYRC